MRTASITSAIRRELQASPTSDRELAREYNLNRGSVRKWRRREDALLYAAMRQITLLQ